ncbi:MAG TPA: hypothetical protein PL110_04365 [Candidatus Eremiobacteraeota bacterium]|nr:hypothetical protein [Candidatus Eremiobacteraeota bacterium]
MLIFFFLLTSIMPVFPQTLELKYRKKVESKKHNPVIKHKKTIVISQISPEEKEQNKEDFIPTQPFFDLIIVGMAEGTVSSMSKEGTFPAWEDGLNTDGRIALYVKGSVMGKYGITATYDTEDRFRERLFENLSPSRFYPIYGDGSNYYKDGQSRDKLYIKINLDKSYLMYGNFSPGFTGTEFASYNRTFPGFKVHYENSETSMTFLRARTNQTLKKDEIRGNGLSGVFYLTGTDIIEGSERIWIETKDRDIPDLITNSQAKIRNKDYTIDYERRTILFKEPVPSVDETGNPLYIIAQYECKSTDEITNLAFRGDIQFNENLTGGITYLNEDSIQNLQLMGLHSNFKISDRINIYGEYAHSRSLYGEGGAGKIELSANISSAFGINGFYRKVDDKFYNPSSSVNSGTTHYGLEGRAVLLENNLINFGYLKGENEITHTDCQRAQINYRKNFGTLQINGGYTFKEFNSPNLNFKSHILNLGLQKTITENLTLMAGEEIDWTEENFNPERVVTSTTTLGAEYLFENGVIGYIRQDFVRGGRFDGNNTIIGFRSPMGLGENTSFYAQYALNGAISGSNNQASIGLNSRVNLTDNILVRLNYERLLESKREKPGEAIGLSMELLGSENIKSTIRYEIRNGEGERERLIGVYGDVKIMEDLSLIGRYTYSELYLYPTEDFSLIDSHLTLGMAYRPLENNRLNFLARYDIRRYRNIYEENSDVLSHTGSIEGIYNITDNLEFFGKYAYKKEENHMIGFSNRMDLFAGKLTCKLTERFSIFGEARYLRYLDTDKRTLASMLAGDYLLWQNWMIEGGYVFKKFEKFNEYNNNTQSQGPFVKLLLKY